MKKLLQERAVQKRTKKTLIRTQFNTYPKVYKKRSAISLTVPDQNMTIRQLLDNHSRGIPSGVTERKGEYFDTEIPQFDDLTEIVEYKKMLQKKHKELDLQVKTEIEAKQTERALSQKLASTEVAPQKSEETEQ